MSDATSSSLIDETTLAGYSLLRESCAAYRVDDFALFEMRGEDRKAWLQGQCTNDVRQLTPGSSLSFCICAPTGHVLAVCTAWAELDRYLIACAKNAAPSLRERAEAMVILEDVQLREVTAERDWITIQGPSASAQLSQRLDLPPMDIGSDGGGTTLLRHNRTGLGGWDILTHKEKTTLLDLFPRVGPEAVWVTRLEAGIPIFGVDITQRTLPPEMGPQFEAKHISYSKGCYTGQEVIMRIHSRGHTNRTWVGLLLDGEAAPGDRVSHAGREDEGTITSVGESPRMGWIAGAMVRNEAAFEREPISVAASGGVVAGEIDLMPLLKSF